MVYKIKTSKQLTDYEIKKIIALWEHEAWYNLEPTDFKLLFEKSEFHLLLDTDGEILSVLRLNFDFNLKISEHLYSFTEMGGLVSSKKGKGYGRRLIELSLDNITGRNLQTIGFCSSDLRPFYKKCAIDIQFDGAKNIKEKNNNEWFVSEDDDLLIIHLSEEKKNLLNQLGSENYAYLIEK